MTASSSPSLFSSFAPSLAEGKEGRRKNVDPETPALLKRLEAARSSCASVPGGGTMWTFVAEEFVLRLKMRSSSSGGDGRGSSSGGSIGGAEGISASSATPTRKRTPLREHGEEETAQYELVFVSCRLQTPERFVYEFSRET
jgi:hypothetical protein